MASSTSDSKPLNPNAYPFLNPVPLLPLVSNVPIWFPRPSLKLSSSSSSSSQYLTPPYVPNVFWWSANGYFYNLHHPQPAAYLLYHRPNAMTCYDVTSQVPMPLSLGLSDGNSRGTKFGKAVGGEQTREASVRKGKFGGGLTRGARGFDVRKSRKRINAEKCSKTKIDANQNHNGGDRKAALPYPTSSSIVPAETTTVMIKNIPNQFKRRDLLHILDNHCRVLNRNNSQSLSTASPRSEYDFVYLPMDFWFWFEGKISNLGYAFVNFTTAAAASRFSQAYHGYEWEVSMNKKVCQISWAKIQGKMALNQSFKKKIFWCHSDQYLPVVLAPASDGIRRYKPMTVGKRIATVPPKPIKRSF